MDTTGFLVATDWLADNLERADVAVIDSSVVMNRTPEGQWQAGSGRAAYEDGHIPGAVFVDLLSELQDRESALDFMLPPPDPFADAMGALGVGGETFVVVYATAVPWWATRLWWMLRAMGHDRVAVLDGGFAKWRAEGRAISSEIPEITPARFTARHRPRRVAGKSQVLAAGGAAVINALSPQLHSGESDLGYGRPGRIAGSANLSALHLIDPETGLYLPEERLRAAVAAAGIDANAEQAICYCGGGIAATMSAMVLEMLGHPNVAVYDASLREWAADEDLPMETG